MFKFCNHKCEKLEEEALKKAWMDGFCCGVSKQWDFVLPLVTQNFEKLILKIKEESAKEAVTRLQGNKK